MSESRIGQELRAELGAVAAAAGCELLAVECKGGLVRVVLDHAEGVTLEHCSAVSREASAVLDAHDFGTRAYTLEVTSPGLDRPLYRPEDYSRFVGRLARVTFTDPADGRRRTVVARLAGFDQEAGEIVHLVEDQASDRRLAIPLRSVQRARLEIEL